MSASGRSSDTSRKLLFLLLSLLVIAGLFTAIIAVMLLSQGSADERRVNSTIPVNSSGIPAGSGTDLPNSTTISGITRSSLGASLALLQSTNDSAAWRALTRTGDCSWRRPITPTAEAWPNTGA